MTDQTLMFIKLCGCNLSLLTPIFLAGETGVAFTL